MGDREPFKVYFTALEEGTTMDDYGVIFSPGGMAWPSPEFVYTDQDGIIWVGQRLE